MLCLIAVGTLFQFGRWAILSCFFHPGLFVLQPESWLN